MELVTLVILVVLLQYMYFGILVGKARATHGIDAPATTGNEIFERTYRVQMNTMEILVALVPAMFIFGQNVRADVAAGAGVIYIIGRFIYLKSYVTNPKGRTLGFSLSYLPLVVLVLWGLGAAIMGMM